MSWGFAGQTETASVLAGTGAAGVQGPGTGPAAAQGPDAGDAQRNGHGPNAAQKPDPPGRPPTDPDAGP